DVDAMPEGTVFFPDEPVLRIIAPLPLAQLVETRIINILHFQILIASKAARVALAAPGKLLVDFGLRRSHGAEAGLMAARAGFIAGLSGTSNVLAGMDYNIPVFGTMAHSYILAHDSEKDAFLHYARSHPDNVVLLIDTYDTERAAEKVVAIAPQLKADGIVIRGVRMDSGDLAEHAGKVRKILNQGGLSETTIFASGNLDEYKLAEIERRNAPIDGYGIGTRMNTSSDAPYLDCAYKLQEYAGIPRRKTSEGKATWPGQKQVYRHFTDGIMTHDEITTEADLRNGKPLIEAVMRNGELLSASPSPNVIRERVKRKLATLPEHLRSLERAQPYPVEISDALKRLAREADARAGQPHEIVRE
ncbi:MAG: nicotinate phosphoribosyltransferase, partial [Mariprofundaceae bacterium]|nr:nicotinate phosphoribosyltransferase [Mariprofundaceae bacterium]